jgi:hypothetical protein
MPSAPIPAIVSRDSYPFMALEQNLLRLVPIAVLLRALQVRAVVSVQVLEDAVLVFQAAVYSLWRRIVHCRQGPSLCLR